MLRELSGLSHLDDLDRRYSALLPTTLKEVNTVRLHKAIDIPGLTFYEPLQCGEEEDSNDLILVTKQYHDISLADINVHLFCPDDDDQREKLRKSLSRELNWGESMTFSSVTEHLMPMLMQLCNERGRVARTDFCYSKIMMLKDHDCLSEPPEDNEIQVRPLSRNHIPTLVTNWKYCDIIGRERITRGLELMVDEQLCYGTFVSGQLASWVVTMRYACMGMLHTLPEHRRKGLARHCVSALSRRLLDLGVRPYVLAEEDNATSQTLFRSMGFVETGNRVQFVAYEPGESGYEINEG